MIAEVRIPEVGESITEGTLAEWLKQDGAYVEMDEPLFVLETDKVTMEVAATQTTAMSTTFNEADVTNLIALRSRHRETFLARYGIRPGFMSFFVKAVVDGLKSYPQIKIRPMTYLAFSHDHQIVDGREAAGFLKRIVECIETPERMMLEV